MYPLTSPTLLLVSTALLLSLATPTWAVNTSVCGNWELYKDEKCIKVFHDMLSNEDALKACHLAAADASILSIRSAEEQAYFANFLHTTHGVVDSVWLGGQLAGKTFKWTSNEADFRYSNWAPGKPSLTAEKSCVEMIPDTPNKGKWSDEPCSKQNRVVCQKPQQWSLARMQQTLLDARKEFRDSLDEQHAKSAQMEQQLRATIDAQQKSFTAQEKQLQGRIDLLEKNPVPLNFIYVQLPKQPAPKTLWPAVNWKDVSVEYAGHFFRAEGGGAAPFGQCQVANAPHLVEVQSISNANAKVFQSHLAVAPGAWTKEIFTGQIGGAGKDGLKFLVSGGEVHPHNYAVKIWKRV